MLKCYHFDNSYDAVHCDVYKLLNDDPVRPHIPVDSRFTGNKFVFSLRDTKKNIIAIACTAFTDSVVTCEEDLNSAYSDTASVCMFYTLWSYKKGAGRELVYKLLDYVEQELPHIQRVVTLSPLTEMAKNFHTKNGAIELGRNTSTVNFEYFLDRPEGVIV